MVNSGIELEAIEIGLAGDLDLNGFFDCHRMCRLNLSAAAASMVFGGQQLDSPVPSVTMYAVGTCI